MAPRPPRSSISVCSGVGGLDLGLSTACGVEPVVYIEREAFSSAILVARMEDALLGSAPIWDDVCTFDARPWRGLVDLVAGGTPCQDLSVAGKRAGLDGSRSRLFFEHVRIAVECEAPFFFWENVAGAASVVPRVCEYLEERGYRGAWTIVRASDVGAPHQRARIFLLAYSESFGRLQGRAEPAGKRGGSHAPQRGGSADPGAVANPNSPELRHEPGRSSGEDGSSTSEPRHARSPVADSVGQGLEVWTGLPGDTRQEQQATKRGGLPLWPPAPDDRAGWQRVIATAPRLAPAKSAVRRVANGLASRVDRLRACGNGVVPAQAAHAWRGLWDHLVDGR